MSMPRRRLVSLLTCLLLLTAFSSAPARAVVYGEDDRYNPYEVGGSAPYWHDVAVGSTAALIKESDLGWIDPEWYFLTSYQSLEDLMAPLCPGERYAGEPTAAWCSGALIDDDLFLTAGHCVRNATECDDTAFVFGYEMLDPITPVTLFPEEDVYFCSSIVARVETSTSDWAIVQVDRPVNGRYPVPIRYVGDVESDPEVTELGVLGHPVGLPVKGAAGGTIRPGSGTDYFVNDLDTFGGNSGSGVYGGSGGSPVFSRDGAGHLYFMEGILVRGYADFEYNGFCNETIVCPESTGCDGSWQEATRCSEFSPLVPPVPLPGRVPDGAAIPGPPLTIEMMPSGEIALSWSPSCMPGDDYEIYEGVLGDFLSHAPRYCTTGGATTMIFPPSPDSAYYLVVARTGFREGSYGQRSDGLERPQSAAACLRQEMGACP